MEGTYLNSLSFDITANWIGLMIMLKMLSAWGVGGVGDLSKLCGTLASNRCLIDPKYSVTKQLKCINMPKIPLINKTKYNNMNINNFIFKIVIENFLTLFDKKYPNVSQKLLFVFKGIHRGKYFQHSHWRTPRSSVRSILQVPLIKKNPKSKRLHYHKLTEGH